MNNLAVETSRGEREASVLDALKQYARIGQVVGSGAQLRCSY